MPLGLEFRRVRSLLDAQIAALMLSGVRVFVAGGAIGFDMLAAETIIQYKKEYAVTLNIFLPCRDYDKYWDTQTKQRQSLILRQADNVSLISESYSNDCMSKRNHAMCAASSFCIAYVTKSPSGSSATASHAAKNGLKVIYI